jgi:hemin uptake protein HemP
MTPPDHKSPTPDEYTAQQPIAPSLAPLPQIEVGALLGESREAMLVHNGETYRLRITASNKLILTK